MAWEKTRWQAQWGPYKFGWSPLDHIGINYPSLTNEWPVDTNEDTGLPVRAPVRNPQVLNFTLAYAIGHTDDRIEHNLEFWRNRQGETYPFVWSGDLTPVLTPNPMMLNKINFKDILMYSGGTIAYVLMEFEFTEMIPSQAHAVDPTLIGGM